MVHGQDFREDHGAYKAALKIVPKVAIDKPRLSPQVEVLVIHPSHGVDVSNGELKDGNGGKCFKWRGSDCSIQKRYGLTGGSFIHHPNLHHQQSKSRQQHKKNDEVIVVKMMKVLSILI